MTKKKKRLLVVVVLAVVLVALLARPVDRMAGPGTGTAE